MTPDSVFFPCLTVCYGGGSRSVWGVSRIAYGLQNLDMSDGFGFFLSVYLWILLHKDHREALESP